MNNTKNDLTLSVVKKINNNMFGVQGIDHSEEHKSCKTSIPNTNNYKRKDVVPKIVLDDLLGDYSIDGFKISISYDYIMVEDTEAEFEEDGLWEYYYEDANKEIRRMSDIAFECELSKPLDVIKQWLERNIMGTSLI